MAANLDLLLPGEYYHIYNRAIGNEKLFLSHENYIFFLYRCQLYLWPIADILSFCLLPNHFHFFLRIKQVNEIENLHQQLKHTALPSYDNLIINNFLVDQFGRLFNSYAKSFNLRYSRKGRLFMEPFKRKMVKDDTYFNAAIHYIHGNPVHHRYCAHLEEWIYSSYNTYLGKRSELPSLVLLYNEILEGFGGIDQFITFHQQNISGKSALE